MNTISIIINEVDVLHDARAATWKTGRVNPQENGLHGEKQISDEELDLSLALRSAEDAVAQLQEATKQWEPQASHKDGAWTLALTINSRCTATNTQVSQLALSFVVAHVVKEWYGLVEPDRIKEWQGRKDEAEARLLSELNYKRTPTL